MKQITEKSIQLLNELGYPIATIDETSPLLTREQLHLQNSSGLTLVEYLSLDEVDEVQMLIDDKEFALLFLRSLKFHQIEIPLKWQTADDFIMVCDRDKKIAHAKVSNGLFYYCTQYRAEHRKVYQSIIRKNGGKALLFTLDEPNRHLTIDETISSLSDESAFFTYAHVTIIKRNYTLRFYFNADLDIVKTTATDNLLDRKVQIHEVEGIKISNHDYQAGLDILKELQQLHRKKIEDLDFELKPNFFFITNGEILKTCQDLILEINALKSPIYDQRQRILQRLQQPLSERLDPAIQNSTSAAAHSEKIIITPTPLKSKPQLKSKKDSSQRLQLQQSMQKELLAIVGMANNPTLTIQQLESLFKSIQNFEISIIYQIDSLSPKYISNFEKDLKACKDQIIKHIHQALKYGQHDELNALYDIANEYIDGLLIGLIRKFQNQLLKVPNFSASERHDIQQLLDLIMHFYPKNSFYRAYLDLLSCQYGFTVANGIEMYSMIRRIMHVLDDPQFIFFLIRENLFAPTDCICVNECKYLSLLQFLFLGLEHLHPSFFGLLEYLTASHYSILDVTEMDKFQSFIEKPKQFKTNLLNETGRISTNSEMKGLQKICSGLTAARPISIIDFGCLHPYHVRDAIHANVAQDLMLQNPSLAFLYLATLLNLKHIYRRSTLGETNYLGILTSSIGLDQLTVQLASKSSQQNGINYIFYPTTDTNKKSVDNLLLASTFLEKLKRQPFIQAYEGSPSWLVDLYQAALTSTDITTKSNGILAVILYLILIPIWSPDLYRKYCFYNLNRIDCLIEDQYHYLYIASEFELLVGLMRSNTDIKTQKICLGVVQAKLEKLMVENPQYQSLKSELFP